MVARIEAGPDRLVRRGQAAPLAAAILESAAELIGSHARHCAANQLHRTRGLSGNDLQRTPVTRPLASKEVDQRAKGTAAQVIREPFPPRALLPASNDVFADCVRADRGNGGAKVPVGRRIPIACSIVDRFFRPIERRLLALRRASYRSLAYLAAPRPAFAGHARHSSSIGLPVKRSPSRACVSPTRRSARFARRTAASRDIRIASPCFFFHR